MIGPGGRISLTAWLAGVAAGDPAIPAAATGCDGDNIEESGLDIRTHAMVCLAALVAVGENGTAYDEHIAAALDRGVTPEEVVGVLVALVPAAGAARVTAAAPAILAAIQRVGTDILARSETSTA